MNLRALQYFVKLADLRHFSKAADACFVSQPTLSTQIKKLEEELGVQLVERSPKMIMLTPVGEEIANRARLVLRDIEQIRTVAAAVPVPINVLARPNGPTVEEIGEAGGRRVSVGGSLASTAYGAMMLGARELLTTGTSTYLAIRLRPEDRAHLG